MVDRFLVVSWLWGFNGQNSCDYIGVVTKTMAVNRPLTQGASTEVASGEVATTGAMGIYTVSEMPGSLSGVCWNPGSVE